MCGQYMYIHVHVLSYIIIIMHIIHIIIVHTQYVHIVLGTHYSPGSSCGYLEWTRLVRSPPSSSIILSGFPSGQKMVWSMHHSYSSSVSPFQAYTAMPRLAMAAAEWSCVEKMLHELHCTCLGGRVYRRWRKGDRKMWTDGVKVGKVSLSIPYHVLQTINLYYCDDRSRP